jgi:hypothetical protein
VEVVVKRAVLVVVFGLWAGCSRGSDWVDVPRLCTLSFMTAEEMAATVCGQPDKPFTGEYECGKDGKPGRVKCK